MAWIGPVVSAAAPLIGGLLGGSGTSPYSATQQQGINGAFNGAQQLNGVGSLLQGTGQQANQAYQSFAPTAGNQVQSDINLLNQNPYTDSYSTALLNQSNANNAGNFEAARSNLTQGLESRGLAGSGGGSGNASSALAGGLSGINSQQAATSSGLQNNIATNAIQQRYANLAQAAQLAQQYSGQLYGQGVGGLTAAQGAYGQAGQLDLGAAGAANNLAQQQIGQNNQYTSALGGAASTLGSLPGILGAGSSLGGVGSMNTGLQGAGNQTGTSSLGGNQWNTPAASVPTTYGYNF
jgi:hypothetical protein